MLRMLIIAIMLLMTACASGQSARDPSGAGPVTVTDHTVAGGSVTQP